MLQKRLTALILSAALLITTVIVGVFVYANTDSVVTAKTYDFENGQRLPYSGLAYKTEADGSNTYLNYAKTASYSTVTFKTDYVLQKNTEYQVTFKYKYDGKWLNRPLRPMLGNSTNNWDFFYCGDGYTSNYNRADYTNLMGKGKNTGYGLGNTNGQWVTASFTFDTTELSDEITDSVKYLGFLFQTGNNTYDLSIDDITVDLAPQPITERIEYTFEDSQNMDYGSGYSYATESNGNRYMTTTAVNYGMRAFRTGLELSANSKYVISFKYKFNGVNLNRPFRPVLGIDAQRYNFYDCDQGYDLSSANIYAPNTNNGISLKNSPNEWVSTAFVVDTSKVADKMVGTKTYYMSFGFQSTQNSEAVFSIDDLVIEKIVQDDPDNYVINGGFENGKLMWNDNTGFAQLSADSKSGEKAVQLKDGNYSKISQTLALESNKNYKLTFWYKGTTMDVANWAICHDNATTESQYIIKSGAVESAAEWTKKEVVFSTGSHSAVILLFQSVSGCDFMIDGVSIADTTEAPAADEEFTAATLTSDPLNSQNVLFIAKEGTNIITDHSFEEGNGNWKSLTNDGTLSVTDEKAHDGSKSLKFSAAGLAEDVWSYAYFELEPDTDYFFSAWVLGENWSETNKNDLRFGIVDADSGYFILPDGMDQNSARIYSKTEQRTVTAWDGNWHLINIKFNSGSAKLIAFGVRGNESVAYFDEIQLFKNSDREKYLAEHEKITDATIVLGGTNGMTDCDDEDNLIENGDLSGSDISFWSSGENFGIEKVSDDNNRSNDMHYYGNFIDVAETGSTKGKALHYAENTSVTGVGLGTYYKKWITVEPDTEYTFSADILILKQGNATVSLVDNNPFYPNQIASFAFDDEYFDEDFKWQKFSFMFNSGDHTEIGFFVSDSGGEGYIDNIRLFKSTDAVLEEGDGYPNEITSDTYTVKDEIISGFAEKTTIADALAKIDGTAFLKVYKNGTEITDKSQYIGTGMEIRYMDGVSIYARATAVVGGDVDGDGVIGSLDIVELLKVITFKTELNELQTYAADLDKNQVIDVNDVAMISNHISGKKKLSVLIVK